MSAAVLTDEEIERARRFWQDDGAGLLGRDMLALIDEVQRARAGEPLRPLAAELNEDDALLALADACSAAPSSRACREFTALHRAGWTIEWTLSDEGFVIVSTRKSTEGDRR